ncbi:MAG: NAD(P)H-hydrate dehydratase [Verrucomicrobiota bacterium]
MHHLPILSNALAKQHEAALFADDPSRAEAAMRAAGTQLGAQLADDCHAFIDEHESPELILLLGKGNNTGDTLYAAAKFAEFFPDLEVLLVCTWNPDTWSEAVSRAFKSLQGSAEITQILDISSTPEATTEIEKVLTKLQCSIVIDGIFGMSFRPPLPPHIISLLQTINNSSSIRLRVAVDIPSGICDSQSNTKTCFRSDLTYATGILKQCAANAEIENVGRLKMIDLGFFSHPQKPAHLTVLSPKALQRRPRNPLSDKRTYGHLFIMAGSRKMPGALIMATQAAIRSGVGLVTVIAPASLCTVAAVQHPEAMWLPSPETLSGELSIETIETLRTHLPRASAILIGPGMGRNPETFELMQAVIRSGDEIPIILDADALQTACLQAMIETQNARPGSIITPHAGELHRISQGHSGLQIAKSINGIVVEKGTRTWIHSTTRSTLIPFGNPSLARGGSGDILAGLIAGRASTHPEDLEYAACYATALHGRAADRMAADKGEQHLATTDLLNYL